MNALAAPPLDTRAALLAVADGMDKLANLVRALATPQQPAFRMEIVPGAGTEVLLSLEDAAKLLGVSTDTVARITKGKTCRRRVGRRVLIERSGLLALTKRG